MNIDVWKAVIVAGIALLLGWGVYLMGIPDSNSLPVAIAITVCCLVFGGISFSVNFKRERGGVMIKTMSGIWGFVMFVLNLIFLWLSATLSVVIIVNGILLLIFLLLQNLIYKSKM